MKPWMFSEALADLGVEAKMPSLEAVESPCVGGSCRSLLQLDRNLQEMTDGKSKKKKARIRSLKLPQKMPFR